MALIGCVGAAGASAQDGGFSAPRADGAEGGAAAPRGHADVAEAAQAGEPSPGAPDAGQQPSVPVDPDPGAGAPDGAEPGSDPEPPADDDRGVDIVVPLPDDPADERQPAVATTPTTPPTPPTLPRTGYDVRLLALIGLLLLGAGAGARGLSRPARAASA
jgi:hypothetical protein